MKKRSLLQMIGAVSAAALLLSGCSVRISSDELPHSTDAPEAPAYAVPSAEPTAEPGLTEEEQQTRVLVHFECEEQDFRSDDGSHTILSYSYSLPVVTIPERPDAAEAINSVLRAEREKLMSGGTDETGEPQGLELMLERAREDDSAGLLADAPYAFTCSTGITRCDAAVISIVTDSYTYLGGVHGMTVRSALTFDTETGERLALSDLAADGTALLEQLNALIGEQAAARKEILFDSYADSLGSLIGEDNWYLDQTGITVVAQPYELAPYASGIQLFSVSYKTLSELLHPRILLPARSGIQGGMIALRESELDADVIPVVTEADIGTDGQGERVLLRAVNRVYDLRVFEAVYVDYSGKFEPGRQYLAASRLNDGEFVRITAYFPDVIPDLMLSWRLPDGTEQSYLISQSGEDGSILFIDPITQNLQPGEITAALPYLWDLNGDGTPEMIDIRVTPDEDEGAAELAVSSGDIETALRLGKPEQTELWIADPVGSGEYLLGVSFLSGGAWKTRMLRFGGELVDVFIKDGEKVEATVSGRITEIEESTVTVTAELELLGKHTVERVLEAGPERTLVTVGGTLLFSDADPMIRTRSDLKVTLSGGQTAMLAAGTTLRITDSDGKTFAGFVTAEGLRGSFPIAWSERNRCWLVDGTPESSVFEY